MRIILDEIRKGQPINKADAWICKKYYTENKLKIEQLLGEALSMDQCYISFAIVEQTSKIADRPEE